MSLDLPASGEKINDPELDDEAVRLYGEQMYWEDYRERNPPSERRTEETKAKPQPEHRKDLPIADWFPADGQVGEDDGPF